MSGSLPTTKEVFALHKYFMWANRMRTHFDKHLKNAGADVDPMTDVEGHLYLAYWYGGLYVVIEGWRSLGLKDPVIAGLLESPNVALLKRYRNGAFHYQKKYWDSRFLDFIVEGIKPVDWVRELNRQFGRFFLEHTRGQRQRTAGNCDNPTNPSGPTSGCSRGENKA